MTTVSATVVSAGNDPAGELEVTQPAAGLVAGLGEESRLVGWNSSCFDLVFLSHRARALGVGDLGPELVGTGRLGKYGTEIHEGTWMGVGHHDVCFAWEAWAQEHGVAWSLKPVAGALGLEAIRLDASRLEEYTDAQIRAYNLSDARLARELYRLSSS